VDIQHRSKTMTEEIQSSKTAQCLKLQTTCSRGHRSIVSNSASGTIDGGRPNMTHANKKAIITGAAMSYSSLWRRFIAFLFDWLFISIYIVIIFMVNFTLISTSISLTTENIVLLHLLDFFVLTFPVILYFSLFECSSKGGTLGKQRFHLRVVRTDGGQLALGRAFLRSILKFLPWQLSHVCLRSIPGWPLSVTEPPLWVGVGFSIVWILLLANLVVAIRGKIKQTIYDYLVGSIVVDT